MMLYLGDLLCVKFVKVQLKGTVKLRKLKHIAWFQFKKLIISIYGGYLASLN